MFCSLILLVGAAAFQAPAREIGTITGQVVDSATGAPIPKAKVTLVPAVRRPVSAPLPETTAISDAGGNFRVTIAPGTYQTSAERNGYVKPATGGITSGTAVAGQAAKGISLKLSKQSVIEGTVSDEDGEPVAHARVQCLRPTLIGINGQRGYLPQGNGTTTDDLGHYRLFGLPQGKCAIAVEAPFGTAVPRSTLPQRQVYATVFFPGVTNLAAAQAIETAAGATRGGVDVRLQKVRVVQVSGRVVTPLGASASTGTVIALVRRSNSHDYGARQYGGAVTAQGDFQISNVPAGSYVLITSTIAPGRERLVARREVEVADRDINGLTISLEPVLTLIVQVRATDPSPLANVSLSLQPHVLGQSSGASGRTDAGGRISVTDLERDVYRYHLSGLPSGFYVKSLRLGSTEVNGALDLTAGISGELTVTLEKGTAALSGQVRDQAQRPLLGIQVIAFKTGYEFVTSGAADAEGHYSLTELAPGEYRIVVIPEADLADPDRLEHLILTSPVVILARAAREIRHFELP